MMHGQAEALLPLVDEAMRASGLTVAALDLVAVTTGPGSFTGIRVGLAAARGIALAANLPLLGVTGFEAAAAGAEAAMDGRCLVVALESRRADLYVQLFDGHRNSLCEPVAVLPEALAALAGRVAAGQPLALAGDAAGRAMEALAGRPGVRILADLPPPAVGVARAALRRWRNGEHAGRATPLYLRAPDATPAAGRAAPATA